MYPRPSEDHTASRPLSGIEQLMESCSAPLQVLPQSKLIENTTKYIQDKLNTDKLGQDWTCPHVKLLVPMRYYKSKSQYFPAENISHLDTDTSQLDMPSRGKYSIPIKNMELWEKRARSLVWWLFIPMLTYFHQQCIYACNKSLCQLMPCPDSWKQWPNQ